MMAPTVVVVLSAEDVGALVEVAARVGVTACVEDVEALRVVEATLEDGCRVVERNVVVGGMEVVEA